LKVYPYLTPPEYPPVASLTEALGHDIQVNCVEGLGNIVKGILAKDVAGSITASSIHAAARRNLDRAVTAGDVELRVYDEPEERPVMISAGFWLSASTLV